MDLPSARSSAISRLPPEILREIFDFALSTWLLPGDGNNIFDDLWLFVSGCFSYREYWRTVHIWRTLRSTCRRWYCLLEGQIIPLATTNLEFYLYLYPRSIGSPAIQRLETYTTCWEFCNKKCGSCMVQAEIEHQSMGRQSQKTRPWSTSTDFNRLDRLQIFVHQGDQDLQDYPGILAALHRAPLLRALSTISSLYNPTNPVPSLLTHLHLYGHLDALPQLQLPLLKYLALSLECQSKTSQSISFSFFSWVLPVLVTLRLDGEIEEEEGELIQELVVKCSPTVVNLMLDLTILKPGDISGAPLSVIYPVLHLFPHLAALGLSTSHLMLRTPIPLLPTSIRHPPFVTSSQPSARSLSLLVLGMTRFNNGNDDDQDDPSDDLKNSGMLDIFDREEVGYTPWSLARVLVPFTWSGLGAIWDERYQTEIQAGHGTGTSNVCHLAEPAWAFLNYFIGKKLEILDADGVELHDEKNGGMAIFKPFM